MYLVIELLVFCCTVNRATFVEKWQIYSVYYTHIKNSLIQTSTKMFL